VVDKDWWAHIGWTIGGVGAPWTVEDLHATGQLYLVSHSGGGMTHPVGMAKTISLETVWCADGTITRTRRIYAGRSDIMCMSNIKALCFDTGGTILDWHTGMRTALAVVGARHGAERDWAKLANEFRRRSLKLIVNHGEHAPATMTFDDAHRDALDRVLADNELDVFSEGERRTLWWIRSMA
jgi:hypothetical protein